MRPTALPFRGGIHTDHRAYKSGRHSRAQDATVDIAHKRPPILTIERVREAGEAAVGIDAQVSRFIGTDVAGLACNNLGRAAGLPLGLHRYGSGRHRDTDEEVQVIILEVHESGTVSVVFGIEP